jgi:predicted transcriptional regulator
MNAFLSARINTSINDELTAIASQENQTKTAIIKEALNLYLKNRKQKLANQMSILYKIEHNEKFSGENNAV